MIRITNLLIQDSNNIPLLSIELANLNPNVNDNLIIFALVSHTFYSIHLSDLTFPLLLRLSLNYWLCFLS